MGPACDAERPNILSSNSIRSLATLRAINGSLKLSIPWPTIAFTAASNFTLAKIFKRPSSTSSITSGCASTVAAWRLWNASKAPNARSIGLASGWALMESEITWISSPSSVGMVKDASTSRIWPKVLIRSSKSNKVRSSGGSTLRNWFKRIRGAGDGLA